MRVLARLGMVPRLKKIGLHQLPKEISKNLEQRQTYSCTGLLCRLQFGIKGCA